MKTAAVIAEYNPFHMGHAWQLKKIREESGADAVIVIMSGDYVQRGEPALLSMHDRANMALHCGADLVLELPFWWSAGSAAHFAQGACRILAALNCVDVLYFGSERADSGLFSAFCELLYDEPEGFRLTLKEGLKKGYPYPKARSIALCSEISRGLREQYGEEELDRFLAQPNNILGIEYCLALKKEALQNPGLRIPVPAALKRVGADYHDLSVGHDFCSASAIRNLIRNSASTAECSEKLIRLMPDQAASLLSDRIRRNRFLLPEDYSLLCGREILKNNAESLAGITDLEPELANRIFRNRFAYEGWESFISLLKTRNTTYSHLSRALLHLVLKQTEMPDQVEWIRVLGVRKERMDLLGALTQSSRLPVITQLKKAPEMLDTKGYEHFRASIDNSDLYEFVLAQKSRCRMEPEEKRKLTIINS